jgi:hypothetical protein
MTLGNMRSLGVRSLAVTFELCHHAARLEMSTPARTMCRCRALARGWWGDAILDMKAVQVAYGPQCGDARCAAGLAWLPSDAAARTMSYHAGEGRIAHRRGDPAE